MRSKIVYLLGAGFSAPLGLPVMSNFLERSKDLFAAAPDDFAHFAEVFSQIGAMAQAKNYLDVDLFNIEQILSILDMEDYARGTRHRDTFTRYLADTVTALTPRIDPREKLPGNWHEWLFTEHEVQRRYCQWVAGLFGARIRSTIEDGIFELAESVPSSDYGIITLNYDLVLERCLERINHQVAPVGGLSFSIEKGTGAIPLAKIHGSAEPLTIVPPTWQKRAGEEVQDAWQLAVALLTEANEIRILGFSFPETDGYVKYLLSLGVMRAPHVKWIDAICLDPSGRVQDRYESFFSFPKFRFRNVRLEEYFSSYGNRNDERVIEPWHGHSSVYFTGIDRHHHEFMGRS